MKKYLHQRVISKLKRVEAQTTTLYHEKYPSKVLERQDLVKK
jgi:hypothetical protein